MLYFSQHTTKERSKNIKKLECLWKSFIITTALNNRWNQSSSSKRKRHQLQANSLTYSIIFKISLLCINLGIALGSTNNYTVLRVSVQNEPQLEFLHFQYLNTTKYDFWREPSVVGKDVHVMVKDSLLQSFIEELDSHNITHNTMIDNVERVIRKRASENTERRTRNFYHDAPFPNFDSMSARNRVHFRLDRYHSFSEIIDFLNSLAINYRDRVQVQPIGESHEGRQIALIKIGTKRKNLSKSAIWIDGGIHAREWVSPATVLYFIHQLVTEYDNQPLVRNFVDQFDWYIVPLLNPDGYEFSRSSPDPETRLWRKNRSPLQCTQTNTGFFGAPQTQCCQGVDLNRNFDWFYGQVGSSTDPCSEIYSGTSAFSEPETRSVRDFITQLSGRVKTFLTFHSYSQILMFPFGHALRTYSQDVSEMNQLGNKAAKALQSVYNTQYKVGTGADTLYPASGGSEDWAKGRLGVRYSYLFELRPDGDVYDGFLLPENQIIPTARETWEAVKTIANEMLRQYPAQVLSTNQNQRNCRDTEQLCSYWAQNGACPSWPSMRQLCPASCGFC